MARTIVRHRAKPRTVATRGWWTALTTPGWAWNATDTVAEVHRIQTLARAAGLSFAFPLALYGGAALVSSVLLAATPIWVYNGWWAAVALTAPFLIARHYHHRLRVRGIAISRSRAIRYTVAGELLAVVLWFAYPLWPVPLSAPWLALSVGAVLVGRAWRDRALYAIAAGVALIVAVAAAWDWRFALTDLTVGLLLCAGALWWRVRVGALGAMLPPR